MTSVLGRVIVATVFVLAWCAPFYVDAAVYEGGDLGALPDAAFFAFYGALTLLTGSVVRWPALLLPVVVYLALLPLGVNPEDSDGWTYAGLYAVPGGIFSFPVLLIGCLGGSVTSYWLRRRRATA